MLPPWLASARASVRPAAASDQSSVASGPPEGQCVFEREMLRVSLRPGCSLHGRRGSGTQILAGRLCMPIGTVCCSRSEFQSQIDISDHCSPDRGHRTSPWHPSGRQTAHRPHRCGGDLAFPPESTIAVCGIGTWVVVAGGVGSFANSARGRSESSSLFREYGWTLGVVDGESILPNLGLLLSQDEAWRKINGRIGGRR